MWSIWLAGEIGPIGAGNFDAANHHGGAQVCGALKLGQSGLQLRAARVVEPNSYAVDYFLMTKQLASADCRSWVMIPQMAQFGNSSSCAQRQR